jgi:hypothetical protein
MPSDVRQRWVLQVCKRTLESYSVIAELRQRAVAWMAEPTTGLTCEMVVIERES